MVKVVPWQERFLLNVRGQHGFDDAMSNLNPYGFYNVGLGALMALATDSLNQSKVRGGRLFGFEPVCEL